MHVQHVLVAKRHSQSESHGLESGPIRKWVRERYPMTLPEL